MTDPFAPLNAKEKAAGTKTNNSRRHKGVAIVPVPDDAPQGIPPHRRGLPVQVWQYRDASGKLMMKICRFDKPGSNPEKPDKEFFPLIYWQDNDGSYHWVWLGLEEPRPLYGLDRLASRPDAPVLVCEGEKSADAGTVIFSDHVAITSPNGAGSAHKADWSPVAGRRVIIWPDRDDNGQKYAAAVAQLALAAKALSVYIVQVPENFLDGWDLADNPPEGITQDDLRQLLNDAIPVSLDNGPGSVVDDKDGADLAEIQRVAERMALLDDAVIDKRLRTEAAALEIGKRTLRKEIKEARLRLERECVQQEESQEVPKDPRGRVDLEVVSSDLPDTATELAERLAAQPMLFDRGGPARVSFDAERGGLVAELLSVNGVVNECHKVARPWQMKKLQGGVLVRQNVTLPERVANLYLDQKGRWGLRPLDGIARAPLLAEDGSVRTVDGYDPDSRLLCEQMPDVQVPANPTRNEAESALLYLRRTFRTFAFSNAVKVYDSALGVEVVDLTLPPGEDESAALSAVLTAVCRPSLWLAPAIVVRAPAFSGAGTGKGLFLRSISALAFGTKPQAMTAGATSEEFDKRISAALIGAAETLFLDNMNGTTLKSDVLASALTERPCRVRPLGRSTTVPLNASTLVLITGNGLALSEDMARRCLVIELDAGLEDPEQRPFKGDLVTEILSRRGDLLQAALTIWRWGRQNEETLTKGKPLGSYAQWCRWVRDPLLTLGCCDPADKVAATKANDPRRRIIVVMFNTWWAAHKDNLVTIANLHETVRAIVDPEGRGRQYVAAQVRKLEATRAAGFVLTRSAPDGKWTADRYQLFQTHEAGSLKTIGDHRAASGHADPVTPMPPMPPDGFGVNASNEAELNAQNDVKTSS